MMRVSEPITVPIFFLNFPALLGKYRKRSKLGLSIAKLFLFGICKLHSKLMQFKCMYLRKLYTYLLFSNTSTVVVSINGHGRLIAPAGRASLWRNPEFKHLNPTPDYNDNECFCGGFNVQYELNEGKCGVCGDPWNERTPRAHEDFGTYGKGIITGNYTNGQVFNVSVQLTAAHLGYFEFRLCPHRNISEPVTQDCLDKFPLPLADNSGTKYLITTMNGGWHNYSLRLPQNVTCQKCVLQW